MSCVRTLVVPVTAARIDQDNTLRGLVNLHIAWPEIAVDENGLDASPSRLERAQEPRDYLLEKLVRRRVEVGIGTPDAVLPLDVGTELTGKVLLPRIAPAVDHRHNSIEGRDVETKPPLRRGGSPVQLSQDLCQLGWPRDLFAEALKRGEEKRGRGVGSESPVSYRNRHIARQVLVQLLLALEFAPGELGMLRSMDDLEDTSLIAARWADTVFGEGIP